VIGASRHLAFLATAWACAITGCHRDGTVGPCYVRYNEPILTITAATDARTGAPLSRIIVRDFSYDDRSRSELGIAFLTDHFGLTPRNVLIEGSSLRCDIVCAFGAPEGRYQLTIGATNYRDTTFTVAAKYGRGSGDCPATLFDGVRLEVQLTPAG
jgi:hypothetical protein